MSRGVINFSKDNEYYTPKIFVKKFGSFDYDPSTTRQKANELGIKNYDTIETNGLLADWTKYNRIWINPPFTIKHLFLKKAVETFNKTRSKIYFLAPIAFLTTRRFYEQIRKIRGGVKLYIPNGRIKFESGLGKDTRNPAFGSVVFTFQDTNEIEFIELPDENELNQLSLF